MNVEPEPQRLRRPPLGRSTSWRSAASLTAAVVLTLTVSDPRIAVAQSRSAGANLVITVLDPLGQPAADIPLLLENGPFQIPFVSEGYTDRSGRYRVRVPAGTYAVSAPVDFFPPTRITVPLNKAIEQTIRMEIGETIGTFSICVNCPEADAHIPSATIVEDFRKDREAAINEVVSGAEPEVGWEFFQPRAPDALRRLGDRAPVGTVVLEGHIAVDGQSRGLRVVSAADPVLAAAATVTLEATRWRPARVRGRPVEVPLRITLVYTRE